MSVLFAPRVGVFIIAALVADTGVGGVAHAAATAGRIYRDMIPKNVNTYPAIVVQNMSDVPAYANGAQRVLSNTLWLVKIIAQDESQSLNTTIGDRVNTLLLGLSGTTSGVYVPKLTLDSSLAYPELDGVKRFAHLDLTYRAYPHAA